MMSPIESKLWRQTFLALLKRGNGVSGSIAYANEVITAYREAKSN